MSKRYLPHIFERLPRDQQMRVLAKTIRELDNKWDETKEQQAGDIFYLERLIRSSQWSYRHDFRGISERQDLDKLLAELDRSLQQSVQDHQIFLEESWDDLLKQKDDWKRKIQPISFVVAIDNLRSAFNVGSILRTCECLGVEKVLFSGYTATPDEPKVQKTSMGTSEVVEWERVEDLAARLVEYKERGYQVIALETVPGSPEIFKSELKQPVVLILGNERYGIAKTLLEQADQIVQLPVYGGKNSLNVGVAFGAAGYYISNQLRLNTVEIK